MCDCAVLNNKRRTFEQVSRNGFSKESSKQRAFIILWRGGGAGGGLGYSLYMGYVGMCGPKAMVFLAVLVLKRICFFSSSLEFSMLFFCRRSHFFIIIDVTINKSPSARLKHQCKLSNYLQHRS